MNYEKHYLTLVQRAKTSNRKKSKYFYYEAHHIIPLCMGGTGDARRHNHPNIVLLTAKEHYVAHLLLCKFVKKRELFAAFWCMNTAFACNKKVGSKTYEWIRKEAARLNSGENNRLYGKTQSDEVKQKISQTKKGTPAWNRGLILTEKQKCGKFKPIRCIDTGKIYKSAIEAEQVTGVARQNISKVCLGIRPRAGTYKWEFVNDK